MKNISYLTLTHSTVISLALLLPACNQGETEQKLDSNQTPQTAQAEQRTQVVELKKMTATQAMKNKPNTAVLSPSNVHIKEETLATL